MGQAEHSRLLFPNVPKSQLVHEAAPSFFSVVPPTLHSWHCVKSVSSADRDQPLGHLRQNLGQVFLQALVLGHQHAQTVLLDAGERFRGVDSPLVQYAVDAVPEELRDYRR